MNIVSSMIKQLFIGPLTLMVAGKNRCRQKRGGNIHETYDCDTSGFAVFSRNGVGSGRREFKCNNGNGSKDAVKTS